MTLISKLRLHIKNIYRQKGKFVLIFRLFPFRNRKKAMEKAEEILVLHSKVYHRTPRGENEDRKIKTMILISKLRLRIKNIYRQKGKFVLIFRLFPFRSRKKAMEKAEEILVLHSKVYRRTPRGENEDRKIKTMTLISKLRLRIKNIYRQKGKSVLIFRLFPFRNRIKAMEKAEEILVLHSKVYRRTPRGENEDRKIKTMILISKLRLRIKNIYRQKGKFVLIFRLFPFYIAVPICPHRNGRIYYPPPNH